MNFITEKAQLEKENEEVGDMDFSSPIFLVIDSLDIRLKKYYYFLLKPRIMNFITEKAQLEKENKEVGDMDFSSPIVSLLIL